jgi:hypothetical protein
MLETPVSGNQVISETRIVKEKLQVAACPQVSQDYQDD